MEVESRREKEKDEYELQRKDRDRECSLKTQKKSMKRRMKKEKLKIFKEASKEGGKKPDGEGSFLDRVKEKYGDDVLVRNQDEHSSDKSEGSLEEPSEEEVGPKFEEVKNDIEATKPAEEKVLGKRQWESVKRAAPI